MDNVSKKMGTCQFIDSLKTTFKNHINVEILPYGLGDKSSIGYINIADVSSTVTYEQSDGQVPIKIETIDNLFFNQGIKINYIKADLEGHEINMLLGAEKTIKAYKPKIAITTYHAANHAKEIENLLKKYNPEYKIKTKGIEERAGAPVMLHAW